MKKPIALTTILSTLINLQLFAQFSNDTFYISPQDEFIQQRIMKFDTEKIQSHGHFRSILLYEDKPFTGTIVKKEGLFFDPIGSIVGSFGDYHVDAQDSSFFCINYQNGHFSGEYIIRDKNYEIYLNFNENGHPDDQGIIIFKGSTHNFRTPFYFNNVNTDLGVHIDNNLLTINISPNSSNIGIFNYKNHLKTQVFPYSGESLNYTLSYYFFPSPTKECRAIDTFFLSFEDNYLESFRYQDPCNTTITFTPGSFIHELPVIEATGSQSIDYNRFIESKSLLSPIIWYKKMFISESDGYFFGVSNNLPEKVLFERDQFRVQVIFDKKKMIETAEPVSNSDPTSLRYKEVCWLYEGDIYYIQNAIKEIHFQSKENNKYTETVYLRNEHSYILSGKHINHTNKDTFKVYTSGNFGRGIVATFNYYEHSKKNYSKGRYREEFSIKHVGDHKYKIDGTYRHNYTYSTTMVNSLSIEAMNKDPEQPDDWFFLIPHGISTYTLDDGTIKKYQFNEGKLILD